MELPGVSLLVTDHTRFHFPWKHRGTCFCVRNVPIRPENESRRRTLVKFVVFCPHKRPLCGKRGHAWQHDGKVELVGPGYAACHKITRRNRPESANWKLGLTLLLFITRGTNTVGIGREHISRRSIREC